jgi:hypothetical protein
VDDSRTSRLWTRRSVASPSCLILRAVFILKTSLLDLESDTRIVPFKIYAELMHGSFGLILDGPRVRQAKCVPVIGGHDTHSTTAAESAQLSHHSALG